LLSERFKLVVHHEKKAVPVYELLVARGGLKIKELDTTGQPGGPVQRQPPKTNTVDAEGFPVFPAGTTAFKSIRNLSRYQAAGETMEALAKLLAGQLKSPVTDATGLKGKYGFTLSWLDGEMPGESATAQPLQVALSQQLGLTLQRKQGDVEILVVDHVEKEPADN